MKSAFNIPRMLAALAGAGGLVVGGPQTNAKALAVAATLCLGATLPVGAAPIYSNDFEGGSTANFSGDGTIQTPPSGVTHFLGYLANGGAAVLTLNGISAYSNIGLSFDLYTVRTLDGDGKGFCCGPDNFMVTANATTLMDTTFATRPDWTQDYPVAGSAGGTGSDSLLTGQLGPYVFFGSENYTDYTYHLSFTNIASNVNTLTITFFGNTTQSIDDEAFGIDNILVTGTATNEVPLPAALPLFATGLGLIGIIARRRRRRKAETVV